MFQLTAFDLNVVFRVANEVQVRSATVWGLSPAFARSCTADRKKPTAVLGIALDDLDASVLFKVVLQPKTLDQWGSSSAPKDNLISRGHGQ